LVFTVFLSFAPIFVFFAPFLVYESSPLRFTLHYTITLLPEAVRHWLIWSFLGLLILADVLVAAAHARFTLLFALVQALLLYYLYTLYTPSGDRQTRAIRELKKVFLESFFSYLRTPYPRGCPCSRRPCAVHTTVCPRAGFTVVLSLSLHSSRRPTDTGNLGVEKSSLKVSSLICSRCPCAVHTTVCPRAGFTVVQCFNHSPPAARRQGVARADFDLVVDVMFLPIQSLTIGGPQTGYCAEGSRPCSQYKSNSSPTTALRQGIA
jgi:hypothetical protein